MRRTIVLALFVMILSPLSPRADGFIIPVPPEPGMRPPPLSIKYYHVHISIDNQVASTEVDQVFINDHHREIEGTFIFPIPEEASITDFSMFAGERFDRDETRQIYQEIVRREMDPGILEYGGRDIFRDRVDRDGWPDIADLRQPGAFPPDP